MKTSLFTKLAVLGLVVLSAVSCKDKQPQFVVEGKVGDADSTVLYFEKRSLTETSIVDSVRLDKDGAFKFEQPAPQYGEFYLLRLNNQGINIAIDSIETVVVNASKPTFATEYTIEGSPSSSKIKEVTLAQYKLSHIIRGLNEKFEKKEMSQNDYVSQFQEAVDEYKKMASETIHKDYISMAAYFTLFQKVNNFLVFDPYDKKDRSVFQATATAWQHYRSGSPRAVHLEQFTLGVLAEVRKEAELAKRMETLSQKEITEAGDYYETSLPDMNNNYVSLSSLRGKVVILDFTAYNTEFSPAHNIILNRVYEKYKSQLQVYQVSFDANMHTWQNAAVNLPWIRVRDSKGLESELVRKFNIQGLPTTFLVDKNGNIVKRLLPNDDLEALVKKLL